MLTLFDYLPSQNGYKIRLLLNQLGVPYRSEYIGIFEGEGQSAEYKRINPTGAVPAIRFDDGRVLSESNAILFFLADGTALLPEAAFSRAKVLQWMSFEGDYLQPTVGSLRYWTLTGKIPRRPQDLVEGKRQAGAKALRVLDTALADSPFLVDGRYSIADISLFAYTHLAPDAGYDFAEYPALAAWIGRIKQQPGFLEQVFPYSIDPYSTRELP